MRKGQKTKRRRIRFNLSAPDAASVVLAGDFNGWSPRKHLMKQGQNGLWEKTVVLLPGRYEYKFLVDGQWTVDPQNPEICRNSFGTSNNIIAVSFT